MQKAYGTFDKEEFKKIKVTYRKKATLLKLEINNQSQQNFFKPKHLRDKELVLKQAHRNLFKTQSSPGRINLSPPGHFENEIAESNVDDVLASSKQSVYCERQGMAHLRRQFSQLSNKHKGSSTSVTSLIASSNIEHRLSGCSEEVYSHASRNQSSNSKNFALINATEMQRQLDRQKLSARRQKNKRNQGKF